MMKLNFESNKMCLGMPLTFFKCLRVEVMQEAVAVSDSSHLSPHGSSHVVLLLQGISATF